MTRVTTTCPQCSTIFRVNPEQLAARRGQVRCGRCRHVFNGYETVSVGPDQPDAEAPPASPPASNSGGWWPPRWLAKGDAAGRRRSDRARAGPAIRAEGLTKMVELVRGGPDPANVEPGALRVRPAFGIELEQAADDFSLPSEQLRRRALRIGLLVLVVAIPVAIVLARDALVQAVPSLRPLYAAACAPLGCRVPLPADADAWSVESNELLEDPGKPRLFHFTATLRNRSRYVQAYPTLDLRLTDMEGMEVDRREVPPAQYLPAARKAAEGQAPNSEVAIRIEIKAADRRSQGYRLVLFFP